MRSLAKSVSHAIPSEAVAFALLVSICAASWYRAIEGWSFSCVNTASQYGAIAALDGPDDSIHQMMEKFTQRRNLIHKGLNELPGVECSLPGGAFYAFPKVIGTGMNAVSYTHLTLPTKA